MCLGSDGKEGPRVLELLDLRRAPNLAPLLVEVDIGPSATELQVSCNGAASVAERELRFLVFS